MGTYFLDPIQLYRLTAGLKESTGQPPNIATISEVIKQFWEGVEPYTFEGGDMYRPLHSYRSKIYHTVPEGVENVKDWFKKFKEFNCNH